MGSLNDDSILSQIDFVLSIYFFGLMKFILNLYVYFKFGKVSSFLDCLTIFLVNHK
jgi:hypothetical protein